MYDLVADFGAVLNNNSAATRDNNKTAILKAFQNPGNYTISTPGKLYLPANANITMPVTCGIWGSGMWANQTQIIGGGGNMFNVNNSLGIEDSNLFRDISLQNEIATGTLVMVNASVARITFENVLFGTSLHHVYQDGGIAGDWVFEKCYFASASGDSIYLSAYSSLTTICCNHGANLRHLHLGDGGAANGAVSAGFTSIKCVYQGSANHGIIIIASGADLYEVNFHEAWFENNGMTAGAPDIFLQTAGTNKIHQMNFFGGAFHAANNLQTTRIDWYEGGGTIGDITFFGTMSESLKPLAPASPKIYINKVKFIGSPAQTGWKTAVYS